MNEHDEPTLNLPSTAPPPAGWYPQAGQLRYWDGQAWTEHRQAIQVAAPVPVAAPQHAQWSATYTTVVTDSRTNPGEVAIAWVITLLTLGYMLPWAVAATRGKSNSGAIALLNFLLGWTFIGWLAALVMACMAHQVAAVRTH